SGHPGARQPSGCPRPARAGGPDAPGRTSPGPAQGRVRRRRPGRPRLPEVSDTMFSARRTWTVESTSTTVEVAFTDTSVDFAEGRGRDPGRLADSLQRLSVEVGVPVARMRQVHGRDVAVVDSVPESGADADAVPTADVLVTSVPGLALMTRAA